ncbi:MAG: DUF1573 domain-containing protein [Ginsengibacter sp.]
MKKVLLAALVLSTTSLFAQKKANDIAKLNVETYNFGNVKQNVPAKATVIVTNIGTGILLIEEVVPSCGCTNAEYTKTPIAPGKTGSISVTYNAAALGHIDKTLTVKFAGADDVKFVKLTGEVLTAAAYDSLNKSASTQKKGKKATGAQKS